MGALIVPLLTAPALAAGQVGADTWQQTWSDEFDAAAGTSIDGDDWNFDLGAGGWGNNELQTYTNNTNNVAHDGAGNLVITARKNGNNYTSGRIHTLGKVEQTYGRVEARIKVPTGQGVWPAFWMLGADFPDVGWPRTGEIDIMEHIGSAPDTVHGTIHGPGYSGGNGRSGSYTLPNNGAFPDDFHTFAVEWLPNEIKWYVDDQLYHTRTPQDVGENDWVFDHDFFVIFNVAVGGNWPGYPDASTSFPQQMKVDYVRMFERVPGTRPGLEDGAFEQDAGAWLLNGNAYLEEHDPSHNPAFTAFEGDGGTALKLFGTFGDGQTTAEQQRLAVTAGARYQLAVAARVNGDDALTDTGNVVRMFIEFFDAYDRSLSVADLAVADGETPVDRWARASLLAEAPVGATHASVGFIFDQAGFDGGAVWLDAVQWRDVSSLYEPHVPTGTAGRGPGELGRTGSPPAAIPEPTAAALLLPGLCYGLAKRSRR